MENKEVVSKLPPFFALYQAAFYLFHQDLKQIVQTLEVLYKGLNIAQVLDLTVEQAC